VAIVSAATCVGFWSVHEKTLPPSLLLKGNASAADLSVVNNTSCSLVIQEGQFSAFNDDESLFTSYNSCKRLTRHIYESPCVLVTREWFVTGPVTLGSGKSKLLCNVTAPRHDHAVENSAKQAALYTVVYKLESVPFPSIVPGLSLIWRFSLGDFRNKREGFVLSPKLEAATFKFSSRTTCQ
jgi:hypothetical protein